MALNMTIAKPRTKRTAKKGFYLSGAKGKHARRDSNGGAPHGGCPRNHCSMCMPRAIPTVEESIADSIDGSDDYRF